MISGTHGVEGLAGSGCQVGFLVDRLHEALPARSGVLLVHALNPYGFAWLRRVNEDGVDLNRNCVDFAGPLPDSSRYEALHDLLVPTEWEGDIRKAADEAIRAWIREHGEREFQAAVSSGQYTRPTGLFYGGNKRAWSVRVLVELLKQVLPPQTSRLLAIDLHTGLGPTYYGEPIVIPRDAAELDRARQWFGSEVRNILQGESVSARVDGAIPFAIGAALPDLELTFVALEFGTAPIFQVLDALRADHWLHSYGNGDEQKRAPISRQMRDAFFMDTSPWKAAVYGRTADFVMRAVRAFRA